MDNAQPKKLKKEIKKLLEDAYEQGIILHQLDNMYDELSDEHKKNVDDMYKQYYEELKAFNNKVEEVDKIFRKNKVVDMEIRYIKKKSDETIKTIEKLS